MVAPRGDRDRRGHGGVPGAVRRVDGGVQRLQVPYAMNRSDAGSANCNPHPCCAWLVSEQYARECILLCLLISYHIEQL